MAEFYKEHNFNPFSGCLPLLIQLPVFILLYSALMSPQFIADAGKANFLFIKRLDATIKSNAGVSYDGSFGVGKFSKFATGKNAIVVIKTEDGKEEELDNVKVPEPLKSVSVQGEITPGKPLDLKIPLEQLKLGFSQLNKVQKADFDIINTETKETEKISFKRSGDNLVATVPTIEVASNIHYDVIALVILFAITMWLSQKIMMATGNNASQQDPTTAAMQKTMGTLMPIMICGTFFFIPIPAGVLLYLLTSNIFQIAQTVVINKQLDLEEEKKKTAAETTIDNDAVNDAKQIKAKD